MVVELELHNVVKDKEDGREPEDKSEDPMSVTD